MYCIKSHTQDWKTQSKNSLQTILANYYWRLQSKQYLPAVIRAFQTFLTNYYQINYSKILTNYRTLLSTTIWKFIPCDSYTNFYQRTLELITKESFQTIYNYKIITNNSLQTTAREIIANNPSNYCQKMRKSYIYI